MSVPEYVPVPHPIRFALSLPPMRVGDARVHRPAELGARPFAPGPGQGRTGPDAGYALALAGAWAPVVVLTEGERLDDAIAAAAAVAMTRAACAGRGPVNADLEVGLALLGYLGGAPDDLIAWRRRALGLIAGDYQRLRRLVALPVHTLELDAATIMNLLEDWQELIPAWAAVDPDPVGNLARTSEPTPTRPPHRPRIIERRRARRRLLRHHTVDISSER